jgi:hypothetical protein
MQIADLRNEAMIRNARHIHGAPQPSSEVHPGAARAPVPNDAFAARPRMARWREALFRFLLRVDARSAAVHGIAPGKVHEVQVPIERWAVRPSRPPSDPATPNE